MYCPNCGKQIPDNAVFCSFCGNRIEPEKTSSQQEQQPYARSAAPVAKAKADNKNTPAWVVVLAFVVLIVGMYFVISRASGGGLDGTYSSTGVLSQSFTFDGNEITMSAFGINTKGTYKIEGGKLKIDYTLFGSDEHIEYSFKRGDNSKSIYIGGTEFKKR